MQHGLAYEALSQGHIDVTDAYTTDGKLERYRLVVLQDDRAFFPPYQAAPVVRGEVLRRHPEVGRVLRLLAGSLSDADMQRLNFRVEERKEAFAAVAADFLASRGLVRQRSEAPGARSTTLLGYFAGHRAQMLAWVRQHLALTAWSVLLAALVGIPLGIAITRWTAAAPPTLAVAGVIQTIPGLALLAFLIPVPGLGLGPRSAILALSLYALLPILRNTWAGLRSVDPGVLEAARGMGMRPAQILTMVELPLAVPTIMAGLRTSAVITVGGATLAAFIGAGGLGQPILTGLYLNDDVLILAGAVPSALLAILVDLGLGWVEARLAPRGQE
jgi:osmoprotectant transport system permease protein